MLAIKLQRIGKKHQPSYRVVVAERRSKLGGQPVADIGSYNLRTKTLSVPKEKLEPWLKVGAQPSVTVHNLFVKNGLVAGKKIAIKMKKPVKVEPVPAPVVVEAAPIVVVAAAESPAEEPKVVA